MIPNWLRAEDGTAAGGETFAIGIAYPKHWMPALRHFKHSGFLSSHLTRRFLQLSQPVRTLGENLFFRLLAATCGEDFELEFPEGAIVVVVPVM